MESIFSPKNKWLVNLIPLDSYINTTLKYNSVQIVLTLCQFSKIRYFVQRYFFLHTLKHPNIYLSTSDLLKRLLIHCLSFYFRPVIVKKMV